MGTDVKDEGSLSSWTEEKIAEVRESVEAIYTVRMDLGRDYLKPELASALSLIDALSGLVRERDELRERCNRASWISE
jgi:hypothetical protein